MNTITGGLRARLEGFEIDEPGATLPFSARLARENGWTLAFAGRVVQEYKRFLFLTAAAGHPVTPSEEVDQAWHLHMVYTRSYWDRLCGEVLGRPLHHGPTEGGAAENTKFRDWYARTLQSYRHHFGAEPPGDIWPDVEKRFARSGEAQWVDRSRYWLVPRPAWLPRLRRPLLALMIAAALIAALTGPGCTARHTELSPLNWSGAPFLMLYGMLFILCIVWSLRIKAKRFAAFEKPDPPDPLTDPYDIAFLAGGGRRVMQAALTRLCSTGALEYVKAGMWKRRLRPTGVLPDPLHPVESAVLDTARFKGEEKGMALAELTGCAPDALRCIENRLALLGLKPAQRERTRAAMASMLPFGLLLLMGGLKVLIGITRDRPVAFLLICMGVTIVIAVVINSRLTYLTPAGRAMLDTLRSLWRSAGTPRKTPHDIGYGVALFGTAVLIGVPGMDILREDFKSLQQADSSSGGGCSSGCSSSGCGGGGCGGGCGGCGS